MNPFKVLKFCPQCGKSEWVEKSTRMRICQNCGYENFVNPTIGAAGFVFDEKGQLLVVRRSKDPQIGTLDLPGGFCEPQETVEDAIIREVFEETNIVVETKEFLFDIPNDYEYMGVNLYPLDFFLKCNIKDMSNLKLDLEENSEMLFLAPQDINPADFGLPSIRRAIRQYFNK